ncbi:MAG: hypothetical protein IJY14_04460 [Acholeplasmatales bacterium]|nr:hypothetical protein [Acholeplasmatales bacterium]
MEENKVEMLDEVEKDLEVVESKTKPLAEYEKLLIAEAAREDYEKAINLVKFGCFEQKEETTLDFSNLELIKTEKKYKGLYSLYRNLDNMQLMLVCPLVEDNKGDKDERTDLTPYAYDVIYLEVMDNETYQMVCKAAKNNLRTKTGVIYKASVIGWIVMLVLAVLALICVTIYAIDMKNSKQYDYSWDYIVLVAMDLIGIYLVGVIFTTPLVVIARIMYNKDKEQK